MSATKNKPKTGKITGITKASGAKSKSAGRDKATVNGHESYELSYLEEKLGVTRDQVKQAITSVGNNREAVEQHLKNEGSGGNMFT